MLCSDQARTRVCMSVHCEGEHARLIRVLVWNDPAAWPPRSPAVPRAGARGRRTRTAPRPPPPLPPPPPPPPGRAVQVNPMKSKLKPPGTKRSKLKCDIPLSTYAFNFNLRRYSLALRRLGGRRGVDGRRRDRGERVAGHHGGHLGGDAAAGGLGRAQLQGRAVQVDPIKPVLKAPGTKRLKLNSDDPLSKFAFRFNLRRYTKVSFARGGGLGQQPRRILVGRCRLTHIESAYN